MLYTRVPSSRFSDFTVSAIFFPRVPLTKPRTLCGCQPVAFMISANVAPPGRFSRSRILAVLLPSRTPSAFGFVALGPLAAFFAGLVFLGAAALSLPPLALFLALGAPFFGLAAFFEAALSGAPAAPCAATAAAFSVVPAFSVVIFVYSPLAALSALMTLITRIQLKSKHFPPCSTGLHSTPARPAMTDIDKTRHLKRDSHGKKRARQAAFLAALVELGGNVRQAAAAAGIARCQHYEWMAKDPKYGQRFARAWEQALDNLESEAVRRAYEGVLEPVFHAGRRALDISVDEKGQIIRGKDNKPVAVPAAIRRCSDTLLMFLLNGNRPQKYRQRTDARFVNQQGRDRKLLDMAAVEAWMAAQPDSD